MKKRNCSNYCNLGKLISKKLIDMGKNQKWLAETIGINKVSLSKIIIGDQIPSVHTLSTISKSIGIDCNYLIEAIINKEAY